MAKKEQRIAAHVLLTGASSLLPEKINKWNKQKSTVVMKFQIKLQIRFYFNDIRFSPSRHEW